MYMQGRTKQGWRVLYSRRQVEQRIAQMGRQINRDYRGKTVHMVGLMDNGFVFLADLVRCLKVPLVCHFVNVSMRDGTKVREIRFTPHVDLKGKHVILVDAVLRTGVTLDYLCSQILAQKPRSLRAAALVDIAEERKVDLPVSYVGFRPAVKGKYLVGYGLGRGQRYRNLRCLATVGSASTPRRHNGPP